MTSETTHPNEPASGPLAVRIEGDRILAWSLRQRDYAERDIVIGDNEAEAEEVFFGRLRATASLPAESRA